MQLDAVGRDAGLAVEKIEHGDAGNLHRHVRELKTGAGGEHGVEFHARVENARRQRAAGTDAAGIGNLADDRVA